MSSNDVTSGGTSPPRPSMSLRPVALEGGRCFLTRRIPRHRSIEDGRRMSANHGHAANISLQMNRGPRRDLFSASTVPRFRTPPGLIRALHLNASPRSTTREPRLATIPSSARESHTTEETASRSIHPSYLNRFPAYSPSQTLQMLHTPDTISSPPIIEKT